MCVCVCVCVWCILRGAFASIGVSLACVPHLQPLNFVVILLTTVWVVIWTFYIGLSFVIIINCFTL